jgi:hypothetical protein
MTSCKEEMGREIFKIRYTVRGSYPFPLISKGERKNRSMNIGGRMVTRGE